MFRRALLFALFLLALLSGCAAKRSFNAEGSLKDFEQGNTK